MSVNTMTMGPGTLTIGDTGSPTEFAAQLTNVRVTPSVNTGDPINVLSGDQVAGDRTESYALAGTLVQDLGAATGLSEFTWTNKGTTMPFVFVPNTAAGKQISGDVTVEATEIGGDVKTKPTVDFEWQIVGVPAIGDAA